MYKPTLLLAVLAAVPSIMAAPTTLPLNEQALVDATKLVCSQYPNSDYVLIGPLKVPCDSPLLATRAVIENVDTNWQHEYAKTRRSDVLEPALKDRAVIENVDTNWQHEYAKKRHDAE